MADATSRSSTDLAADGDPLVDSGLQGLLPVIEMLDRVGARMGKSMARPAGPPPGPDVSDMLGDFTIVRVIGRGGMGVVYEALQKSLNRRVAIKILPSASADDPRKVQRFLIEAQAAAGLQHPHIVPVHLVASENELHYYAMQFIEGQTLAEVIATARLDGDTSAPSGALNSYALCSPRLAAHLGRQAALALHFAHEQGIIHRDIKPSNLLIDDSGWLWVSDFGLARIAGQADLTLSGAVLGTLRYMSPEQTLGTRVGVDHRADVYALGATLYELITLRPLFEGDDHLELLRKISEEEPPAPRRIDPAIPRDLETIVRKAIAKEQADRYATALEFANDLGRFLEDRPILARPLTPLDHAATWVRRRKRAVTAAASVLLLILLALGGAVFWRNGVLRRHNHELTSALERAERNELSSLRHWYDSQMKLAQQCWASGQVELGQEILETLKPESSTRDPRGFEWHYLRRVCHRDVSVLTHFDALSMTLSPDGRTLVAGDGHGSLMFWDLAANRERARLQAHAKEVSGLRFSVDGRLMVTWSRGDGAPSEIKLWNPDAALLVGRIPPMAGGIDNLEFPGDGRRLIAQTHGPDGDPAKDQVIFWDLSRGPESAVPGPTPIACDRMACSQDGQWLATGLSSGQTVTLRDATTGQPLKTLTKQSPGIKGIAFSPDGQTVAAHTPGLTLWETRTGREIGSLPFFRWSQLAFSPDGNWLAGRAEHGQTVELVKDVKTNPREVLLQGTPGSDIRMTFSPDGKILAGGGGALPVTLWDTSSGRKLAVFSGRSDLGGRLVFGPRGESLIFGSEAGRIRSWHLVKSSEPIDRFVGHKAEVWDLAYSPDGRTLISSSDDHSIKLWDPENGALRATLNGHDSLVAAVAVSPDSALLASAGFDGVVRLWDLPSGQPRRVLRGHTDKLRSAAFSPDGHHVASAGSDKTIRVWDVDCGEASFVFNGHTDAVRALAFAPTGSLLASAANDRTVRAIDIDQGREAFSIDGPRDVSSLAFSPDHSLLASGENRGIVTIWDAATRTKLWSVRESDAEIWDLAFSPDGRTLAAACGDARVRLWDPITGQVMLTLEGHSERVNAVAFAPDGMTLASASHGGEIRLWRAALPRSSSWAGTSH